MSDVYGTFDEMAWMSNYPCRRGYVSKLDMFMQIIVKFLWVYLLLYTPIMKYSFKEAFPIWMLYMISHGYNYAIYFAVNHWTKEAGVVDNTKIKETNWGILQVQNSSNFATDSIIWSNLSGGLNH